MNRMKSSTKAYCAVIAAVFFCFAVLSLIGRAYLWQTNDHISAETLAEQHLAMGGVLGSRVHGLREVKRLAYRKLAPKIVAVGTSRATNFRHYFFNDKFYNLAGALRHSVIRYKSDLIELKQVFFTENKPHYVILTIDYWSYTKETVEDVSAWRTHLLQLKGGSRLRSIYIPLYSAVNANPNSLKNLLSVASGMAERPRIDIPLHGAVAMEKHRGTLPDGSQFIFRSPSLKQRFQDDLANLANKSPPSRPYRRNMQPAPELISGLAEGIEELEELGIEVIVIAPPVAPRILTEMNLAPNDFEYVKEVRELLSNALPRFHDMHDPSRYGSSDCEFEDGVHGGEVTYLRMLLAIHDAGPTVLDHIFNAPLARELIAAHQGLTVTGHGKTGRAFFRKFGAPRDASC
jgi:hypothetical protein